MLDAAVRLDPAVTCRRPNAMYAARMKADPKPRPNHREYVEVLRGLTPEQRLMKAFELGDLSRDLLWAGLRRRFPDASDDRLRELSVDRIERCRRLTS